MANEFVSIHYRTADSPADFRLVEELWRQVYVEELQWLGRSEARVATDRYTPFSTHFLACGVDSLGNEQPLGTLRMVDYSSHGLPVEQFVDLPHRVTAMKPVEIQRFMVPGRYRNQRFKRGAPFGVAMGLIKACVQLCVFLQPRKACVVDCFIDFPLIKTYKTMGFEQVGPLFTDTELTSPTPSVALCVENERIRSCLSGRPSRLFRYLAEPDPAFQFDDLPSEHLALA